MSARGGGDKAVSDGQLVYLTWLVPGQTETLSQKGGGHLKIDTCGCLVASTYKHTLTHAHTRVYTLTHVDTNTEEHVCTQTDR